MSAAAPPDLAPTLDAAGFAELSGATEAQVGALETYRARLTKWNEKMNLVGQATLEVFWSRHAWDSAGLPGIVLAILGKGRAGFHVDLVDSVTKRCRFLQAVVDELALPATVQNTRAEDLDLDVDVATARACAPLHRLLGYAQPYLRRGATGLFLKGQDVASEVEEATRYWDFEADVLPSWSDPRGRIVRVRRLGRARKA
jgi:16S rRNA (guanine527-N7)-methyltransferase